MLKINFLGDSITEGCCADKVENNYVSLVGTLLPALTRNYGIGGTRLAHQKIDDGQDLYYASRVDLMDHDADLMFVFGGTNDYGHGNAPLGEVKDSTLDSYCGSINVLIDKLLEHYKKERIIFILPLHRINENNPYGDGSKKEISASLNTYISLLVDILNIRGIKYVDFRNDFGEAENNPYFADGLHPSNEGHRFLAELICKYIKENFNNLI